MQFIILIQAFVKIIILNIFFLSASTSSDKAGSVTVQATILFFSGQTNSVVLKYIFLQAVKGTNEINGLEINPEFTQGECTLYHE